MKLAYLFNYNYLLQCANCISKLSKRNLYKLNNFNLNCFISNIYLDRERFGEEADLFFNSTYNTIIISLIIISKKSMLVYLIIQKGCLQDESFARYSLQLSTPLAWSRWWAENWRCHSRLDSMQQWPGSSWGSVWEGATVWQWTEEPRKQPNTEELNQLQQSLENWQIYKGRNKVSLSLTF